MRPQRQAGAFYGRRKAKPLKPAQARLMQTLFRQLRIDQEKAGGAINEPATLDPATLFKHNPDTIHIEIGFGGGEYLLHHAGQKPQTGFIGCEPFINGMAKALSEIDRLGIKNIRLYDRDAAELLDQLPDQSISGIDLFYPDPWPKKRHWKRRFVNPDNLKRIERVLKPGGQFRFASDIAHYTNWTLGHVMQFGRFNWLAQQSRDWKQPFEGWLSTRYEQKALKEGRRPAYLVFEKTFHPPGQ